MRPLLLACLLLLLLPAAASAGGWASARVLNAPPDLEAGQTWRAQIEILQHGRTPLTGVEPAVVVGSERFPATPVEGKDGIYVARVVFPRAGRVEYTIDDGFTNVMRHEFALQVREPTAPAAAQPVAAKAPNGNAVPWTPVLVLLGIAALLALTLPALRAPRAPRPAPGSPLRASGGSAPRGS